MGILFFILSIIIGYGPAAYIVYRFYTDGRIRGLLHVVNWFLILVLIELAIIAVVGFLALLLPSALYAVSSFLLAIVYICAMLVCIPMAVMAVLDIIWVLAAFVFSLGDGSVRSDIFSTLFGFPPSASASSEDEKENLSEEQ